MLKKKRKCRRRYSLLPLILNTKHIITQLKTKIVSSVQIPPLTRIWPGRGALGPKVHIKASLHHKSTIPQ